MENRRQGSSVFWKALAARFIGDRRGGLAVSFAIAAPVIFAAGGLALDYVRLSGLQAKLQAVSDNAAIAGARELSVANSTEKQIAAVVKLFVEAQSEDTPAPVHAATAVDSHSSEVRVALELEWTPLFAAFLDATAVSIKVNSRARLLSSSTKICVLTLDASSTKSFHLEKRAVLHANGCGVYANSAHNQAIRLDQQSVMTAGLICAVGGVNSRTGAVSPAPLTDCPKVPDPLADRVPPVSGACDFTDYRIDSGNATLNPGTYCGGLTIEGDANVLMSEGEYVLRDGPLRVAGKAAVEGKYVGIYLEGDASVIEFMDDARIDLTGPRAGPMAGLLLFEDRTAPRGRRHHISSTRAERLEGTIYLPNGTLLIDPNATVADQSAFTAIIAYKLELSEGPDLVLNANYEATEVPVPKGIKGPASIVLAQ